MIFSNIAAVLLSYSRTAYSYFIILIELDVDFVLKITIQNELNHLLQIVDLIILNEISIQHHYCMKIVDCLFQDLYSSDEFFDDVFVIFNDDFIQILFIRLYDSCVVVITSCLQYSHIWWWLTVLHLTRNMRLAVDNDNMTFMNWLDQMLYNSDCIDCIDLSLYIHWAVDISTLYERMFFKAEFKSAVVCSDYFLKTVAFLLY